MLHPRRYRLEYITWDERRSRCKVYAVDAALRPMGIDERFLQRRRHPCALFSGTDPRSPDHAGYPLGRQGYRCLQYRNTPFHSVGDLYGAQFFVVLGNVVSEAAWILL